MLESISNACIAVVIFCFLKQYAMAVFLGNVTDAEQSNRLDYEKLSEVFGDRMVPLQTNVKSDYALCFI